MHGRDAGVLQLAGDARLAEEAPGGRRVGRIAIGQQLDGDIAIEGGVAGAVDDAHASATDLVEKFVARRTGGSGGHVGRAGGVVAIGGVSSGRICIALLVHDLSFISAAASSDAVSCGLTLKFTCGAGLWTFYS